MGNRTCFCRNSQSLGCHISHTTGPIGLKFWIWCCGESVGVTFSVILGDLTRNDPQVKNIIRLISLCYHCDNYIVNPELNVNFLKIVLSRLSSEEETGTSHIILLMSTCMLIITVLWC